MWHNSWQEGEYLKQGLQQCDTCEKVKKLEEFSVQESSISGRRHQCKTCMSEVRNIKDKNGLSYNHKLIIKSRYGISFDECVALLEKQESKCAICKLDIRFGVGKGVGVGIKKHKNAAHVDHDHVTGKVRGLLCNDCNKGLGAFKDDPILLQEAVEYLKGPD